MHAELVSLRQEVAELKEQQQLLPAPAPEPQDTKPDDPHGLRALARKLGR